MLDESFKSLADRASIMMWSINADRLFEWFSQSLVAYVGSNTNTKLGIELLESIHSEDREKFLNIFNEAFDRSQPFTVECRFRRFDDIYRWICINASPSLHKEEVFSGYICICVDIQDKMDLKEQCERQRLQLLNVNVAFENVLKEKDSLMAASQSDRHLYETILSTTPDFIYVIGIDHRFIYANKILLKMWGKTWDEAIGKTFTEIGYEKWHADLHDGEINQVITTKLPIRAEVPFQGTFGRRIYDYIFAPVLDENNEVVAIAGTTRDITDINDVQEALKNSEEALKLSNRRKDEFLAMLAHELRNPLAPISAAAELMKVTALDEKQVKDTSGIITRQIKHLTGLVEDLIDVSRVTRGLIEVDKSLLDIKKVIAEAVEQASTLVESRQHSLNLTITPNLCTVMGDHKRLVQVVSNLLSNAAKYTQPEGNIKLELTTNETEVIIEVTDDGIGIPEELLPHIYDLFTQAERTSDRSQGGLGIGLALVKNLVTLHDGKVMASSVGKNLGSTFKVYLPRTLSEHSTLIAENNLNAPNLNVDEFTIMIVDDNVDAAQTLGMFLEAMGYEVVLSFQAKSAIQLVSEKTPNIFIIDIGLPEMDDNELAYYFRRQPETSLLPMIALTGYGQPRDRLRSHEAGFDYHFVKPVDVSSLLSIIENHKNKLSLAH